MGMSMQQHGMGLGGAPASGAPNSQGMPPGMQMQGMPPGMQMQPGLPSMQMQQQQQQQQQNFMQLQHFMQLQQRGMPPGAMGGMRPM